jgi:hypothetical protein
VTEYLELWFAVEVIAMPDTTNVRPVRERLAAGFGKPEDEWAPFVGRHFGRRSDIVHGNVKREVPEEEVESVTSFDACWIWSWASSTTSGESLCRRAGVSG